MESEIQRKTVPFLWFWGEVQGKSEAILADSGAVWLYFTIFYAMLDPILQYFSAIEVI